MDDPKKKHFVGIAGLFEETEVKSLFIRYVHLIIIVEIVLFLMVLAGYAAQKTGPFPTKLYLFLAFGIPLAITFLLGVVVQAFGDHVFGEKKAADSRSPEADPFATLAPHAARSSLWGVLNNASHFWKIVLLLVAALFLYKLEDMLGFIARAGSQAYDSLVMLAAILIGGATLIGLFWVLSAFRLRNKQMDYQHQYRKEILERLDLMVLDDETIVDRNGRVIPTRSAQPEQASFLTLPEYAVHTQDPEEETRRHERE